MTWIIYFVTIAALVEQSIGQLVFPLTKWCGETPIAENDDDLGVLIKTDMCCRAQQKCDDVLPRGETKYGLTNDGPFRLAHCKCDQAFRDCLGGNNCLSSDTIGFAYFSVAFNKCYDFKRPATCIKYDGVLGADTRCLEYSFDQTKPLKWQWFSLQRWEIATSGNPFC